MKAAAQDSCFLLYGRKKRMKQANMKSYQRDGANEDGLVILEKINGS